MSSSSSSVILQPSSWTATAVLGAFSLTAVVAGLAMTSRRDDDGTVQNETKAVVVSAAAAKTPKRQLRGHGKEGATNNSTSDLAGGKRSRFRPQQAQIKVGCAPSTEEFEKCIDKFVNIGDNVLIIRGTEKGSKSYDGGEARARMASQKSPQIFQGSSLWNGDGMLELLDALGHADSQEEQEPINIICIELGNVHGNDLLFDSIALIRLLRSMFSTNAGDTRMILVKSKLLAMHARSFHNVDDFNNVGGMKNPTLVKSSNGVVQVVGAVGVEKYRATIPFVVRPGDHVLEIGCHHGKTTDLLAKATESAKSTVGVDIGKVCIRRARENYGDCGIRFEVADAWDTAKLISFDAAFHVIYVDVGGLSGADGEFEALALVRQLCCAFKSSLRCIVVKSRCLRDHAVTWRHSDNLLR